MAFDHQLDDLGAEAGTQVFINTDPLPLRGRLLLAQMRGGVLGVNRGLEVVIKDGVIFRIEIRTVGEKALVVFSVHII